jgi:hypothetical protein
MYHYLSKIFYSYEFGLTSGTSTYILLCYSNLENQQYWDRIYIYDHISTVKFEKKQK